MARKSDIPDVLPVQLEDALSKGVKDPQDLRDLSVALIHAVATGMVPTQRARIITDYLHIIRDSLITESGTQASPLAALFSVNVDARGLAAPPPGTPHLEEVIDAKKITLDVPFSEEKKVG